jgi:hypothetical protein
MKRIHISHRLPSTDQRCTSSTDAVLRSAVLLCAEGPDNDPFSDQGTFALFFVVRPECDDGRLFAVRFANTRANSF